MGLKNIKHRDRIFPSMGFANQFSFVTMKRKLEPNFAESEPVDNYFFRKRDTMQQFNEAWLKALNMMNQKRT